MPTVTSPSSTRPAAATDPDWSLVQQVRSGERQAFAAIMRRHNQRLYRLVRAILSEEQAVLDVLQESYLLAFRRLHQFRGPHGLGAWLGRIARNQALARLRRQPPLTEELSEQMTPSVAYPSAPLRPLDQAAQQQLRALLEQALDRLPLPYRQVFMLRAVQQLDTRATAELLELEEEAVKTRYLRAKRQLRGLLEVHIEQAGLSLHEFAGRRCDALVDAVLSRLPPAER